MKDSAVLNICVFCGSTWLYKVRMVRFGYVVECRKCGGQSMDADYSSMQFCPMCDVEVNVDGDEDPTCEECRK